jgi:hypothetical protein
VPEADTSPPICCAEFRTARLTPALTRNASG